jgi:hypothetical protein
MSAQTNQNREEEASWLEKCPVCKSARLTQSTKSGGLFGLMKRETVECRNCGAVFSPSDDKYKLAEVEDTSHAVWKEYREQALTPREWRNIAEGGMSDAKLRETDLENVFEDLKAGEDVPTIAPVETPIILKKNEEVRLVLPGITLMESRAVRKASYGGGSIRVAKGVRIHTGAAESRSRQELQPIDTGTLTLTNKRFVFTGEKHTVNVGLGSIIAIEPYADAIALRRTRKQKTEYFTGFDHISIKVGVEDDGESRTYMEPLSGAFLTYYIEGQIAQMS